MSSGKSILWVLGAMAYFWAAALLSIRAAQVWPISLLGSPGRAYAYFGLWAALIAVGVWQAAVHGRGMSRGTMAVVVGVATVLLCLLLSWFIRWPSF